MVSAFYQNALGFFVFDSTEPQKRSLVFCDIVGGGGGGGGGSVVLWSLSMCIEFEQINQKSLLAQCPVI